MAKREDFTGQVFGDFKAVKYLGNKKWLIQCTVCGETREIRTGNMKKYVGVTCQQKKPPTITINPGDQFDEWDVLSYAGNKKYLCRCSCGAEKLVFRKNLLDGSSKSCGHDRNHYGDLTGKQINEWEVLGKEGYLYKCRCSCGKIQLLTQHDLMSGKSKQCGHGYNIRTDITGRTFGNWKVIKYLGNQVYLCECSCERHTTKAIRKADLLSGKSNQCGCLKHAKARETLLSRYGDIAPNKAQFNCTQSEDERSIAKWIEAQIGCKVELRNRTLLKGKEIDIYIPDYNIGIEYNGNYWHQQLLKDRKYHQNKSEAAKEAGVRLIHIFEYEWKNPDMQYKIRNYLFDILADKSKKKVIYARNTTVREIKPEESQKFLNAYHIQGYANAQIHIGIYGNINETGEELLGVMTFGKPRFTGDYEYELIRMCFKARVVVVGGAQKMFNYFKLVYAPKQVISYQDFSKFTGIQYKNMGLKLIDQKPMSKPNYVWVNPNSNEYFKRYNTTKQRLVSLGLGTEQETEDEIMLKHGYLKIYDCGQLRFEYTFKGGVAT